MSKQSVVRIADASTPSMPNTAAPSAGALAAAQVRPRLTVALVALALVITLATVVSMGLRLSNFAVDDAYITFRHARNLAAGYGFTFNPGDRLLSTTAPLHALVLGFLSMLGFTDLPLVAIWLSVGALLLLCGTVIVALRAQGPLAGLISATLLVSQHWFYRFFPLETVFVLALNLLALTLAVRRRWLWAGVVSGLSMVGRPDSVILAMLLACFALLVEQFRGRGFCVLSPAARSPMGRGCCLPGGILGRRCPTPWRPRAGLSRGQSLSTIYGPK